jgi:hypothetical protein
VCCSTQLFTWTRKDTNLSNRVSSNLRSITQSHQYTFSLACLRKHCATATSPKSTPPFGHCTSSPWLCLDHFSIAVRLPRMTVVMTPRRVPAQGFRINKPYYPDLTVRRSSRLAVDATPVRSAPPRHQASAPPAKRRRLPADTPPRAGSSTKPPHTIPRSKLHIESSAITSPFKRKADEDDLPSDVSPSPASRRKKRKENVVDSSHNQVCPVVLHSMGM